MAEQKAPAIQQEKVKLTVSMILEDLNNGIDRKGIREKYGLSATDVNRLFQHEKLKGARVRTAPAFELEDDTEEIVKDQPTVKKTRKKAEVKADEPAPATSASTTAVAVATEEKEEATAEVAEKGDAPGAAISEVKTPEDEVETKQGLW
jgi:hypothetical protein